MRLEDFILVKDNVFTKEFCQELVDFFENNPQYRHKGEMAGGLNTEVKDTTDLNLFNYPELMERYGDFVLSKFNEVVSEYAESLPFQNKFDAPSVLFYENSEYTTCQIQKYDKGVRHYNAFHFETDNASNCCRVFVFILYLNDVEEVVRPKFCTQEQKLNLKQDVLFVTPQLSHLYTMDTPQFRTISTF